MQNGNLHRAFSFCCMYKKGRVAETTLPCPLFYNARRPGTAEFSGFVTEAESVQLTVQVEPKPDDPSIQGRYIKIVKVQGLIGTVTFHRC